MMRVFALAFTALALLSGVALAQPGPPPGVRTSGAATANDCVKFADSTGLLIADASAACGSGGGSVTWPASGDLVVSNGTSSPAGLAPVTGPACLLSVSNTLSFGACPSAGGTATNAQTGASYVVLSSDNGKLITLNNSGAIAVTLPQAGTTGFTALWGTCILNLGSGTATVTPTTSTFNLQSSRTLATGAIMCPVSDGTNYAGAYASPAGGGNGTVTTVTVASANGFAGTVANATTTPAITVSTSVTGALKGNGTALSQAACADLSNGGTGCAAATGTSGHTLPYLDGANTWSGTQTFGSVVGAVNAQAGTSYTLAATDCGKTVVITNASAITLTILNSLPVGCAVAVEQGGAGQITVTSGSGATLHSAHSYTKTYGQYAIIGLFVDTNGGSTADLIMTGDGA